MSDGSAALVGWANETPACSSSNTQEWRIAIYGGDEKLRVTDMHSNQPSTAAAFDFEEFMYDALGRRVYRRSRRPPSTPTCESSNVCHSVIERYIWDGDQILQEQRAPDAGGDTTMAVIESEHGFGEYAGVVQYVHAGGIDAPVEILRNYDGAGGNPTEFAIFPHANWRGLPNIASYTSGLLTYSLADTIPDRLAGSVDVAKLSTAILCRRTDLDR
jgi:hypothetical protein